MFQLEITPVFAKQFTTLEQRARDGSLSDNQKDLLAKIYHCFLNLSNDPNYPGLNTRPYSLTSNLRKWLKRTFGKEIKFMHSYLENATSGAKRIYWYYDGGNITIIGIAKHPKMHSTEPPKFKDLAKEEFILSNL